MAARSPLRLIHVLPRRLAAIRFWRLNHLLPARLAAARLHLDLRTRLGLESLWAGEISRLPLRRPRSAFACVMRTVLVGCPGRTRAWLIRYSA